MPALSRPTALLLSALLLAGAAGAETLYVTDQYDFNLRSGESTRHKILRQLPSGTPLTVLEIDEDSGYARVRTEDGLAGYMLMQYLQDEPAARSELAEMRRRLAQLQQEPDELSARLGELQTEYAALESSHATLTAENELLEQELAEIRFASANAMRIDRERRELQEQVSNLLLKVDQLEHRNLELANRSKQQWFLIGAGVIVGGIAIGLLLPHLRLRRRRSSRWGSL